jgi:hypothetical protein
MKDLRILGPGLIVGVALIAVASVTGFISYTHICALTMSLGQSWKTAHLMPAAVDGQIVIGSMVLLTGRGRLAWWGWLGMAPGLAESLFANWESGIAHGILAAIWATVPAQAFAVASFLVERWVKAQVGQGGRGGRTEIDPGADPCSHSPAFTADGAVIQAFLHSRDCLGEILSQRALSGQFGLSRARVAELVRPLNGADEETQLQEAS